MTSQVTYDPRMLHDPFYQHPVHQSAVVSHFTPGGYTTGDFPQPLPPPPPRQETWAEYLSRVSQSSLQNTGSYFQNAASSVQSMWQKTSLPFGSQGQPQPGSNYASGLVACSGTCDPSTHAPPPIFGPSTSASAVPINHHGHGNDHSHQYGGGTSCCGVSHNVTGTSFYGLNGRQQQPSYLSQPATPASASGSFISQQSARFNPSYFTSSNAQTPNVYPQANGYYGHPSQSYQPSNPVQLSATYQPTADSSFLQPASSVWGAETQGPNQGFNPWNLDRRSDASCYTQDHGQL
jgi:hypothetical protein